MNQRENVAAIATVREQGAERRIFEPVTVAEKCHGLPLTFTPALEAKCHCMQIGRGPLRRR